jgi:Tol biopolymer transport system component
MAQHPGFTWPESWLPDGTQLIVSRLRLDQGRGDYDLALLPAVGGDLAWLTSSRFSEGAAQASPDGRFIAYVSDETDRLEVYVRPLRSEGERVLVSVGGAAYQGAGPPRWRADGRELFYRTADNWLAAIPMNPATGTPAGPVTRLFQIGRAWDIAADGQRIISVVGPQWDTLPLIVFVPGRESR